MLFNVMRPLAPADQQRAIELEPRLSPVELDVASSELTSSDSGENKNVVEPLTAEQSATQFSREILEMIGSNDTQQSHVLKVLKIASRYYTNQAGQRMPTSMWKMKKHSHYKPSNTTRIHPVCAVDHPSKPGTTTCPPPCGLTLLTRWPRGLVLPDLADRLLRMFAQPVIAEAFLYASTREAGTRRQAEREREREREREHN
jgi:hypothetical protein